MIDRSSHSARALYASVMKEPRAVRRVGLLCALRFPTPNEPPPDPSVMLPEVCSDARGNSFQLAEGRLSTCRRRDAWCYFTVPRDGDASEAGAKVSLSVGKVRGEPC